MSFVAKHIIGSDERLIGVARVHWIQLVKGLIWALIVLMVGAGLSYMMTYLGASNILAQSIYFGPYDLGTKDLWLRASFGGVALLLFFVYVVNTLSTEVALTTRRVVYKTGFLSVEVHEIDLHEIDAANISHGIFGSIFGYGSVYLDCRFVGDVHLPAIRNPYRFLSALHKAQGKPAAPASSAV